jgi:hypothetical protein
MIVRWIREAETGAALDDKLQSVCTCTAVTPHKICWVDELICSECFMTTDEFSSTLSINKGNCERDWLL